MSSKEKNFDEDDEFWTRSLNNWAEDQMLPTLEEARQLAGGIFPKLAKSLTTEDGKKIRRRWVAKNFANGTRGRFRHVTARDRPHCASPLDCVRFKKG